MTDRASPRTTRRPWPILAWVPGYQRSWLPLDIVAGLTVCAILVPEGMAYALPGAGERVAVLADLLDFIRERAAQPGTSAEGVETLKALEERLAAELAATGGIPA